MRTSLAAGALALIAAALTGCVPTHTPVAPSDVIGETLDALSDTVLANATLLVQDASPRVGEQPSYTGEPDLDGLWVIVAACSSDRDLATSVEVEVAVLPSASVTAGVEADIDDGQYRDAVDCSGRPYRG